MRLDIVRGIRLDFLTAHISLCCHTFPLISLPLFDLRQKKEGAIPYRHFLKLIKILAKEMRPLHLKREKFEKN